MSTPNPPEDHPILDVIEDELSLLDQYSWDLERKPDRVVFYDAERERHYEVVVRAIDAPEGEGAGLRRAD